MLIMYRHTFFMNGKWKKKSIPESIFFFFLRHVTLPLQGIGIIGGYNLIEF